MLFSSNCFIIRTANFSGQNIHTESFGFDYLIRGTMAWGRCEGIAAAQTIPLTQDIWEPPGKVLPFKSMFQMDLKALLIVSGNYPVVAFGTGSAD